MEALCMGAKIVLGDIPVLHEIYGNVAKYINCSDPATDLNMLVDGWYVDDRSVIDLLKKHSWEKSAAKLCECMDREAV
jgi:hypothetical protein